MAAGGAESRGEACRLRPGRASPGTGSPTRATTSSRCSRGKATPAWRTACSHAASQTPETGRTGIASTVAAATSSGRAVSEHGALPAVMRVGDVSGPDDDPLPGAERRRSRARGRPLRVSKDLFEGDDDGDAGGYYGTEPQGHAVLQLVHFVS